MRAKERMIERRVCLLSTPTVLFGGSANMCSSEGGEQSRRPHGSDVVMVVGVMAYDWGAGT